MKKDIVKQRKTSTVKGKIIYSNDFKKFLHDFSQEKLHLSSSSLSKLYYVWGKKQSPLSSMYATYARNPSQQHDQQIFFSRHTWNGLLTYWNQTFPDICSTSTHQELGASSYYHYYPRSCTLPTASTHLQEVHLLLNICPPSRGSLPRCT